MGGGETQNKMDSSLTFPRPWLHPQRLSRLGELVGGPGPRGRMPSPAPPRPLGRDLPWVSWGRSEGLSRAACGLNDPAEDTRDGAAVCTRESAPTLSRLREENARGQASSSWTFKLLTVLSMELAPVLRMRGLSL